MTNGVATPLSYWCGLVNLLVEIIFIGKTQSTSRRVGRLRIENGIMVDHHTYQGNKNNLNRYSHVPIRLNVRICQFSWWALPAPPCSQPFYCAPILFTDIFDVSFLETGVEWDYNFEVVQVDALATIFFKVKSLC